MQLKHHELGHMCAKEVLPHLPVPGWLQKAAGTVQGIRQMSSMSSLFAACMLATHTAGCSQLQTHCWTFCRGPGLCHIKISWNM
jgi:hypothetical protein